MDFDRSAGRPDPRIKGWTSRSDVQIPHWLTYLKFLNSSNSTNFENQTEFNSFLKITNSKIIIASYQESYKYIES